MIWRLPLANSHKQTSPICNRVVALKRALGISEGCPLPTVNKFWRLPGKSILQVPDTGTWVLDNTRPFLHSSIVSFWITPACSKERKYHIFSQYWYTKNVPVFTNTGTYQYLGPEVYFFRLPLANSSELALKIVNYQQSLLRSWPHRLVSEDHLTLVCVVKTLVSSVDSWRSSVLIHYCWQGAAFRIC